MSSNPPVWEGNPNFLKEKEELFRSENQKISRLIDNLATFKKILRNAKHPRRHDVEAVRRTAEEIQKAENQIAEIRKYLRSQFLALSKPNQRRICEVGGLEYLELLGSTEEEILPAVKAPGAVDKPEEILPDGMNMFQKINEQVDASQGVGKPSQVSDERTKASRDVDNALQDYNKQAERRWNVTDVIQIPRQGRTPTLKGSAIPLAQYLSSPPAIQKEVWSSLSEVQRGTAVRPVPGSAIPFAQTHSSQPPPQWEPWSLNESHHRTAVPGSAIPFAQTHSSQPPPQWEPWSPNESQHQTAVPSQAHSSQPPPQWEPWSLNEPQHRTAAQAVPGFASYGADIEEMLRQNQEEQRVLKKSLSESKKGILEMQEDIRRAEEKRGREVPKVDFDVEAFMRAREVRPRGREEMRPEDKEGRGGFWS